MLKIKDLTFSYPRRRTPVIAEMDFEIADGGVYGLLGPNGAGKSTLLYLICGLLTPATGCVTLDGVNTRLRRADTLADIFIVPEQLTLPPMTLNAYVRSNAPLYPRFSHSDLERHLATFGVSELAGQKLTSLSMGQRKKVFMSFALACNTRLLLMDEPTNGLDIPGKAAFRSFIASSADDDRVIVISTHQVRDIDHILDHVMIMDEQHMLLNKSMAEISERLAFLNTSDESLRARALVEQPAIGGSQIVIENDGSYDTEVNLETLFELVTTRRQAVDSIFNSQNK